MPKIVIDIKGELKNGDILIFEGEQLKPLNKNILLKELNLKVKELDANYKTLSNEFDKLKLAVNEKLKNYHDILQLLTKEDK